MRPGRTGHSVEQLVTRTLASVWPWNATGGARDRLRFPAISMRMVASGEAHWLVRYNLTGLVFQSCSIRAALMRPPARTGKCLTFVSRRRADPMRLRVRHHSLVGPSGRWFADCGYSMLAGGARGFWRFYFVPSAALPTTGSLTGSSDWMMAITIFPVLARSRNAKYRLSHFGANFALKLYRLFN